MALRNKVKYRFTVPALFHSEVSVKKENSMWRAIVWKSNRVLYRGHIFFISAKSQMPGESLKNVRQQPKTTSSLAATRKLLVDVRKYSTQFGNKWNKCLLLSEHTYTRHLLISGKREGDVYKSSSQILASDTYAVWEHSISTHSNLNVTSVWTVCHSSCPCQMLLSNWLIRRALWECITEARMGEIILISTVQGDHHLSHRQRCTVQSINAYIQAFTCMLLWHLPPVKSFSQKKVNITHLQSTPEGQ